MQQIKGEDWYAEELGAVRHVEVTFTDVDLSEATTAGAMFERCVFHNCRFNGSTHTDSAFIGCDFRRGDFFDATFVGCKMNGSVFDRCTLRPMTVTGGQWQGVTIRGTNLSALDLSGVDLREADLSLSNLTGSNLSHARLDSAVVRESDLSKADLRSASLAGVDLTAATLRGDPARPQRRRAPGRAPRGDGRAVRALVGRGAGACSPAARRRPTSRVPRRPRPRRARPGAASGRVTERAVVELVGPASPTALGVPQRDGARPDDPRWRFFGDDRARTFAWYPGLARVMIPFGCTPAPYYSPDPTCPDGQGFHHGIDIALPCGTPLRAGRAATVLDHGALGPAYGVNPVLLRVDGFDVVIGHTRKVSSGRVTGYGGARCSRGSPTAALPTAAISTSRCADPAAVSPTAVDPATLLALRP